MKSGRHSQIGLEISFTQVPPFSHGLDAQTFRSVWQNFPKYPSKHWQVKELIPATHVPPLRHEVELQSLIKISHVLPSNPVPAQLQVQIPKISISGSPPFWHCLVQEIAVLQVVPVLPFGHAHLKLAPLLVHVAPSPHGFETQGPATGIQTRI